MKYTDLICDGCGQEGSRIDILFGHVSNYDIPEYERRCSLCISCRKRNISDGYIFTPDDIKPKMKGTDQIMGPHGKHIIEDVVSVIDKSLRLYYMFKGVEDLDCSHHRVIQEYITWALEHKGVS